MAAVTALWALVIVVALTVLGALRRAVDVLERVESQFSAAASSGSVGAPAGSRIAEHEVREVDGDSVRFADLLGTPAIYLFMSAACGPCHTLAAELERRSEFVDGAELRVVVQGGIASVRRLALPSWVRVLIDDGGQASRAFGRPATPQAFALDESGVVVASLVPSSAQSFDGLLSALKGGDRATDNHAAAISMR